MGESINPATGELNRKFETMRDTEAIEICKAAKASFAAWRDLGLDSRLAHMKELAKILREKKREYSKLATIEMGRLYKDAEVEIENCAKFCDIYVENSKKWLEDEVVQTEYKKSVIAFEPIGLVLVLMPWNYPFSQVFRSAVPAMVVGNTVVLRHSNSVSMCALAIEDAFRLAGFPANVFRVVVTEHATVPKMIRSKFVDGVSFTGSGNAGKEIAKITASAIKKCVLELGGSNPFIVLEDADIEMAAKMAVKTRIASCGQSCSSSKRFIVVRGVAEDFTKRVIENTKALVVGDPMDSKTEIGPLANYKQLEILDAQVRDAIAKGAKLECGGTRAGEIGSFYQPTVLTGVKKNMKVMKEEVFGPVIPIIQVKSEEEAVKLANETEFGLGGSVWTRDLQKGEKMVRSLDAGMVCVNRGANSDNRMPAGGTKRSGIGREFSRYGLLEFANIKSIIIA